MTFKFSEPAIFELLKTLVADESVFWGAAPPNQKADFIVYQEVDTDKMGKFILNPSPGQAATVQSYIQVDCYSETALGAKTLGKLVEFTLDGYENTVYYGGNSPQDFVVIGSISKQDGDAMLVDRTDEPLLFRNSAVYLVTYNQ